MCQLDVFCSLQNCACAIWWWISKDLSIHHLAHSLWDGVCCSLWALPLLQTLCLVLCLSILSAVDFNQSGPEWSSVYTGICPLLLRAGIHFRFNCIKDSLPEKVNIALKNFLHDIHRLACTRPRSIQYLHDFRKQWKLLSREMSR